MTIQVQEAFRTPKRCDQNRNSPGHLIIKTTRKKWKERIKKVVREKNQITYRGRPTKITATFSTESLKARNSWSEVFQALKENNFRPRIVYPAKLSLKIDGEIEIFHDNQKLKQCRTTIPALQNILKGILDPKDEENIIPKGQEVLNFLRRTDRHSERCAESAAHTHILKQQTQLNGRNYCMPLNSNTEC
jgi:Holliday junction resolvase RusA-like endonuclease